MRNGVFKIGGIFISVFDKVIEDIFIDRMEQNEEITARFINDRDFQKAVTQHLIRQV